jgi:hypothetical protein
MSYKDNAEHLGKGSGVNLSSARKPSHGFGGTFPQSGQDGSQPGSTEPGSPDADGTSGR